MIYFKKNQNHHCDEPDYHSNLVSRKIVPTNYLFQIFRNRAPLSNYQQKCMSLIFIKLLLVFVKLLRISLIGHNENYELIDNGKARFLKV